MCELAGDIDTVDMFESVIAEPAGQQLRLDGLAGGQGKALLFEQVPGQGRVGRRDPEVAQPVQRVDAGIFRHRDREPAVAEAQPAQKVQLAVAVPLEHHLAGDVLADDTQFGNFKYRGIGIFVYGNDLF